MLRRRRRCCAGHCPAMQAEQCCCPSQKFRSHGPQQCLSLCRAGARRLRLFEGVWSGKGDAGLTRAQDSGGHQPDHECHHSARAQPASALTLLCSSDTGSNPNNGHNVSNRCPRYASGVNYSLLALYMYHQVYHLPRLFLMLHSFSAENMDPP